MVLDIVPPNHDRLPPVISYMIRHTAFDLAVSVRYGQYPQSSCNQQHDNLLLGQLRILSIVTSRQVS
jgi:hypothetical protein